MSAGTITLTNGSDAVTGTGTTFTTDLVAGDFVVATVGGITYTLPVKAVGSDTALTLIKKYTGPTQGNAAWNAVPRAIQNQVTAELVVQSTEYLRSLNYDKANWQAVFSASGDITVILPDGSTFTGPSWKKISDLLEGIDPVALQALADQINASAQQVAADRLSVDSSAQQVALDKQAAVQAADTASNANASAQLAKQGAEQSALEAHNDKEAIGDLQAAVDAVKGAATLPLGFPFWWFSRSNLAAGSAPYDGQEVSRTTYPSMFAAVQAGTVPVVTEPTWWADPSKRNCFTLGATAGMFRLPDYNGAQVGSIAQMTLAGGTASQTGSFHGEAPNARGKIGANGTGIFANNQNTSGVFKAPQAYPNGAQAGGAVANAASQVEMDLSLANNVYKDTATDVLAARIVGVWCGQLFGRVTNPGDVDGATLATRVEAINTDLLSKIDKAFIRGLDVAIFGNITIGPGAFNLPNGMLISQPNTLTSALPTTVANTWYHFYLYSNNGTPALEVSTVAPVAYAYPAHQKADDPSRRYIGSARTNASNAFYKQTLQNGQCIYQGDWASQRILAGGVATGFTAMSIGFGTPVTAYEIRVAGIVIGTNGSPAIYSEADNQAANCTFPGGINNVKMVLDLPVQSYPNAYYKYVSSPGAGSGFYVDIGGYKYAR